MGPETANEPLEERLESRGRNERIQEPHYGIVGIPEGPVPDLHSQDACGGYASGKQSGEPDGDNHLAHWVGEFREDNLIICVSNCKVAGWHWRQ